MCQHHRFAVHDSRVAEGAGKGLFIKTNVSRGELVAFYDGVEGVPGSREPRDHGDDIGLYYRRFSYVDSGPLHPRWEYRLSRDGWPYRRKPRHRCGVVQIANDHGAGRMIFRTAMTVEEARHAVQAYIEGSDGAAPLERDRDGPAPFSYHATRDIKAGEELTISYGPEYWLDFNRAFPASPEHWVLGLVVRGLWDALAYGKRVSNLLLEPRFAYDIQGKRLVNLASGGALDDTAALYLLLTQLRVLPNSSLLVAEGETEPQPLSPVLLLDRLVRRIADGGVAHVAPFEVPSRQEGRRLFERMVRGV